MDSSKNPFVVGHRYHVRYQIPGVQRKPREFVADYMGWNETHRHHEFSFRPEAGTGAVSQHWLIAASEVSKATPIKVQYMV